MASLTAVKLDADLKAYYERKVGEGKNKMSVLNAVKNKLLARVISVVNKQELYVKKQLSENNKAVEQKSNRFNKQLFLSQMLKKPNLSD